MPCQDGHPRLDGGGASAGKRDLYAKYRSLLSRDSVTTQIRDLKSQGLSTGVIKDFTAIDGAFNGAPLGSNNLPQTLEGVVDVPDPRGYV